MKPIKEGWKYSPPVVIIRYFLVQGTVYMNWVERFHRFIFELSIFIIIYITLQSFLNGTSLFLFSLLISHLLVVILNGHLFAMFAHDLFWFSLYKDKEEFFQYILSIRNRLSRESPKYLAGACFFGSLSRGVFRTSSDLDIRFFPAKGFLNGIMTSHLVFRERLRAFFSGFPIDVYMIQSKSELQKKMDLINERPVCVYSHDARLNDFYLETTPFEEFRVSFLSGGKDNLEK